MGKAPVCNARIFGTQNLCTRDAGHGGECRCLAADVDKRKSGPLVKSPDLLVRLPAVLDPLHIANECRKQLQELVDVFEPTKQSHRWMTQGQLSAVKRTKTLITQLEELPKPVYG